MLQNERKGEIRFDTECREGIVLRTLSQADPLTGKACKLYFFKVPPCKEEPGFNLPWTSGHKNKS